MTTAEPMVAWRAQAGPQSDACASAAIVQELLYGGSVFGGKSDFLLGDFAADVEQGASWVGILFRQSFPELEEIIERSQVIYAPMGAHWTAGTKTWRWPSGALLRLRSLDSVDDFTKYMGFSYCVGAGTPVKMSDGTMRAIEDVAVGDSVATLDGPRKVTRTWGPHVKECVDVFSGDEWLQAQPVNHQLLTDSSWQSHASLSGSGATETSPTSPAGGTPPVVHVTAVSVGPSEDHDARPVRHYDERPSGFPGDASCWSRLSPRRQGLALPQRRSRQGQPPSAHSAQGILAAASSRSAHDDSGYVPLGLGTGAGSQGGCRPSRRFRGGPPLGPSGSGQGVAPSRGDAAARCRLGGMPDGQDDTRPDTRRAWYRHPYLGHLCRSVVPTYHLPLRMSPCGPRVVYDLTVEGASHYITTDARLVNRNSWIGWDELGNHPTMAPYHRMKSRLRGPAQDKRIRATANPGGRCHAEIKAYWQIAEYPEGRHLIEDAATGMTRMFIRSRVRDNRIGLAADPGYLDRLEGVGDAELVKAWRDGDWDAIPGAYFSMLRRDDALTDPFEIPANWPLFTCIDYGESNPCWAGLLAVDYDDDVWVVDEYCREGGVSGAEHAAGVKAMIDNCPFTKPRKPRLNLAPHDMWTKRRPGEASDAMAPADSFTSAGVHLTRANMERVNGWRNVKDLLYAGRLRFFRGRTDRVLSSLSSVVRDPKNPEDVEKGGDDHAADGLRYGINHVYKPRKRIVKPMKPVNHGESVLDLISKMGQSEGRYGNG